MFIDDRNVGGLPDWGTIYRIINERVSYAEILLDEPAPRQSRKKGWWPF